MPQRILIKYCRYCGRVVLVDAVTCPHCGDVLAPTAAPQLSLLVEQAILMAAKEGDAVELLRPDGRTLSVDELHRLSEPPGAKPDACATAGLPSRARDRTACKQAVAQEDTRPASPLAPPADAAALPAVVKCPGCRRRAAGGDRYCETCGHDLAPVRLAEGARRRSGDYALADYALMTSAAGPAGLLLPMPLSVLVAAAGVGLATWCAFCMIESRGRLRGKGAVTAAVGIGLFWVVFIAFAKAR